MHKLLLFLGCTSIFAAQAPRLMYSTQMGSTHGTHTTFVKGQMQWFTFHPQWSVPITCDHTTLVCTTDGSYTPTGTETGVSVLSDGGTQPGYQYGVISTTTVGPTTTINLVSGTNFFSGMVGTQILTGSLPHNPGTGIDYYNNTNPHTVTAYISPTQIQTAAFAEGDQTNAPYWYGGLWGQTGISSTATYDICNPSGNSFTFRQHTGAGCATEAAQPYITNGSNLYLVFPANTCYIQPVPTGTLMGIGTTYQWFNVYGEVITNTTTVPLASCGASPYDLSIAFNVPVGATNGSYNVTFTFSQNVDGTGATSTRTFPVTVISQPSIRGTPSSYPPLTNQANWETLNRQYLDYYCVPSGGVCTTDDSSCLQHQGYHGKVNVSGTAVTWVSGDQFNSGMGGNKIWINGTPYNPATYNSSTSITLPVSGGTQTGVSYMSGSSWDATAGFILGSFNEPGALYYPDGILTYLFAAQHYNQSKYQVCALKIADLFSTAVNNQLVGNANAMQFQEAFSAGLYQAWLINGSANYLNAINNIATYPPARGIPYQGPQLGWGNGFGFREGGASRNLIIGLDAETAWANLNATPYVYTLDAQRGTPDNSVANDRYNDLITILSSFMLSLADAPCDGCALGEQPFYLAYFANAVRNIDNKTPNDYFLYVAKRTADWAKQWYDITNHTGTVYNTAFNFVGCWAGFWADPTSIRFGPGPGALWYFVDSDGLCGNATGTPAFADNGLNMWANLESLVWVKTGIDTYRQYAHDMFNHSTDGVQCCNPAGTILDPKQTNQIFGFNSLSHVLLDSLSPSPGGGSGNSKRQGGTKAVGGGVIIR